MKWLLVLGAFLPAACASAYDPPVKADHLSAKYQSDLGRCRKQAHVAAEQVAGATPSSQIKSLFTSADAEHQDVLSCMKSRGYPIST